MSTTSNRLKSKYESSAQKISQLYQEFSNIKRNCSTPSKSIKDSQLNCLNLPKKNAESFAVVNEIFYTKKLKMKEEVFLNNDGLGINFENKKAMAEIIVKTVASWISKFNADLLNKIETLEHKLSQIMSSKDSLKRPKFNFGNEKEKNLSYNRLKRRVSVNNIIEIEEIYQNYDKKLRSSGTQETIDSECLRTSQNKFKQEFQMLEERLLIKQDQINELEKQNRRLKSTVDRYKQIASERETLIVELNKEMSEKSNKIEEIAKLKMQKILVDPFSLSFCEDCQTLKNEINQLKLEKRNGTNTNLKMAYDSFFDFESNKQVSQKTSILNKIPDDKVYGELENISLVESEEEQDLM